VMKYQGNGMGCRNSYLQEIRKTMEFLLIGCVGYGKRTRGLRFTHEGDRLTATRGSTCLLKDMQYTVE
jgi:hypothetical protein